MVTRGKLAPNRKTTPHFNLCDCHPSILDQGSASEIQQRIGIANPCAEPPRLAILLLSRASSSVIDIQEANKTLTAHPGGS